MDIHYFKKHPGGIPVNEEEGVMLLGEDIVPQTVVLPEDLGSKVVNVLDSFIAACPVTGTENCKHLKLDYLVNNKRLYVCESDQFYWYTKKDGEQ